MGAGAHRYAGDFPSGTGKARKTQAINTTLYEKLNFIRDIAPVAGIISTANVMIVNPSVPAKTVPDFIACAKANPRKVNMASGGTGTPSHIAGELFKMMTGIDMLHVPYRGGAPALTDLMGGQVQVYFGLLPHPSKPFSTNRAFSRASWTCKAACGK